MTDQELKDMEEMTANGDRLQIKKAELLIKELKAAQGTIKMMRDLASKATSISEKMADEWDAGKEVLRRHREAVEQRDLLISGIRGIAKRISKMKNCLEPERFEATRVALIELISISEALKRGDEILKGGKG